MKKIFTAIAAIATMAACGPSHLAGGTVGEWGPVGPEIVLAPTLSPAQVEFVRHQVTELADCAPVVRHMRVTEAREFLARGYLQDRILFTPEPPTDPWALGSTAFYADPRDPTRINFALIRIRPGYWTRQVVRHELAHAIGGLHHNRSKDGSLLMEAVAGKGLELLPGELRSICRRGRL